MTNGSSTETVYAVCQFDNCTSEECQIEGTIVLALYATEQTAKQHVDRLGYGYVSKMTVETKMRSW